MAAARAAELDPSPADALVYTNRHNLPPEVAVKLSNTDLYNLVDDESFDTKAFNERYADGLVDPTD